MEVEAGILKVPKGLQHRATPSFSSSPGYSLHHRQIPPRHGKAEPNAILPTLTILQGLDTQRATILQRFIESGIQQHRLGLQHPEPDTHNPLDENQCAQLRLSTMAEVKASLFPIFLKTLTRHSLTHLVSGSSAIISLKKWINLKVGILVQAQILVHLGKILQEALSH